MRFCAPVSLCLCVLLLPALASKRLIGAQVLNMSHDLVALGIANQNLTPNNPALDARPLIQAAVDYVSSHSIQVLTLDKGAYYLLSAQQGNAVVIFGGLSNVTVDFAGSTFYFLGPLLQNGIVVYQCSSFTLTNFQTDFINPPYTHVRLTSVDVQNRLLAYETLSGWPDPSYFNNPPLPSGGWTIEGIWAAVFRNGAIVPGTTRMLVSRPITGNTLTLVQDGTPWTQSSTLATLQAGDTVVVTARGGGPPILVWEGDGITLSNITVYGSPTWAVNLQATSNTTVDGVRVMPRLGTGLIGSNADGIHFASVRLNNHIRNSYVTRTLDDAFVLDNQNAGIVVNQSGLRQLTVTRGGFLRFPNGTPVNFVDPVTTIESAGATIINQDPPDSNSPVFNGQVILTFDQDLPTLQAGVGMVYASAAMRGQGSTVEDNTAEDIYAGHGVWINGTIGVVVRRNVVRRTSVGGIGVSQDTLANLSPPAHDVLIESNALESNLGPMAAGLGYQGNNAAIVVASTNNQAFSFATEPSNTNISILNNYIADSGMSGIWIGELNGGLIQNNRIIRWDRHPELPLWIPPQYAAQAEEDRHVPIVIRYSSAVTNQNNTTEMTSSISAPVSFTPPSVTLGEGNSLGDFGVSTAVAGFSWKAVSMSAWITITSGFTGTGNGTVGYSVSANSESTPRSGSVTVAGESFTITQSGVKKRRGQLTSN